jgi:hypothetical protein
LWLPQQWLALLAVINFAVPSLLYHQASNQEAPAEARDAHPSFSPLTFIDMQQKGFYGRSLCKIPCSVP